MSKQRKKKMQAKPNQGEVKEKDLKGVTGGLTVQPLPPAQLAAPFLPGGAVVSAAISGVGTLKSGGGGPGSTSGA